MAEGPSTRWGAGRHLLLFLVAVFMVLAVIVALTSIEGVQQWSGRRNLTIRSVVTDSDGQLVSGVVVQLIQLEVTGGEKLKEVRVSETQTDRAGCCEFVHSFGADGERRSSLVRRWRGETVISVNHYLVRCMAESEVLAEVDLREYAPLRFDDADEPFVLEVEIAVEGGWSGGGDREEGS
jgi:hypothetical protein